jgi:hypothetical protein
MGTRTNNLKSVRTWPCEVCVHYLSFFQVPAWGGDVCERRRVQGNNTSSCSHPSIDCRLYLPVIFYFYFGFTLMRSTWLMFVVEDRLLLGGWDWARGEKRCVIETLVLSGSRNFLGYIQSLQCSKEDRNTAAGQEHIKQARSSKGPDSTPRCPQCASLRNRDTYP